MSRSSLSRARRESLRRSVCKYLVLSIAPRLANNARSGATCYARLGKVLKGVPRPSLSLALCVYARHLFAISHHVLCTEITAGPSPSCPRIRARVRIFRIGLACANTPDCKFGVVLIRGSARIYRTSVISGCRIGRHDSGWMRQRDVACELYRKGK